MTEVGQPMKTIIVMECGLRPPSPTGKTAECEATQPLPWSL